MSYFSKASFIKIAKIFVVILIILFLVTVALLITTAVYDFSEDKSGASTSNSVSKPNVPTTTIATSMLTPTNIPTPTIMLESTPFLFSDVVYEELFDINLSENFLTSVKLSIKEVEAELASGKYDASACEAMTKEVDRLQSIVVAIEADINRYVSLEGEYYYATKVWEFFKQRGYSDVVVSAILGNMMIETSGGSLNLKPHVYDPTGGYYGLCQWSLYYRPDVADMSFENQLEYLDSDMAGEFKTFGKRYYSGFTFEDFLNMTDPAEAALAFAKVYERCSSGSYGMRQAAATTAYDYFVQ